MKHILVTGAGSLLGQGILRMLKIADFPKKIFTADPDYRSSGHWLGDEALIIPKVNEENYIESIKDIVINNNIDVLLIGTDVELSLLSQYKKEFLANFNCRIIVSELNVINISNDKFLTAQFLEQNNFPFPFSVMANDKEGLNQIKEKFGFPLFSKPIDGARSLGIKVIHDENELNELFDKNSNLTVQQYLPEDLGEYTSGCLVINGECKSIVTLKRDLRDGNTYRAYRDEFSSKYDEIIKNIAETLNPDGPVNFQFRVFNDEPVVFEINGRFSGTTPLRYFYGFNEVEALLNFHLYDKSIENPILKEGVVLRTWSDIFVPNSEFSQLKNDKNLKNPKALFYNFNMDGK